MPYIRAWMSLKFGQSRLLSFMVMENGDNGEKWCCHFFSVILDQILFIHAGNDDIHKSLDEFEIWPDLIRDHRVSCS